MITVPELAAFDSEPWIRFSAWAEGRAHAAAETSEDLRAEEKRIRGGWLDRYGSRAAAQVSADADAHQELATQYEAVAACLNKATANISTQRGHLATAVDQVAGDPHLAGPAPDGRVAPAEERPGPFGLRDRVSAAKLTIRIRMCLRGAEGQDHWASLVMETAPAGELPDPTDGPLDLSAEGIRLDAELNGQHRYGSCTTLAALVAIGLTNSGFIQRHMRWDPDTKTYAVTLYRDGKPVTAHVDPRDVPKEGSDRAPGGLPSWLSIYEQAIEELFGDIEHGQTGTTALGRITGEDVRQSREPTTEEIRKAMLSNPRGIIIAGTSMLAGLPISSLPPGKRVVPNHSYTVVGIDDAGNVILRNPWGPEGGYYKGTFCPGEVRLTPEEYHRWFTAGTVVTSPYGP